MKFHPGGVDDMMKAAGKDSTILFDEVSLLCLIEYLSLAVGGHSLTSRSSENFISSVHAETWQLVTIPLNLSQAPCLFCIYYYSQCSCMKKQG